MARHKLLVAILLALTVCVSPSTKVRADGSTGGQDGPVEGHPWDDRTDASSNNFFSKPTRPGFGLGTGPSRVPNPPVLSQTSSGARFVQWFLRFVVARR
jgi:hypothetical protein